MKKTVLCFDSGIGGIPYFDALQKEQTAKYFQWIYLADNAFFPYGEKSPDILKKRICKIIQTVIHRYSVSIVFLLCNTASVLALDTLRALNPQVIAFIGTVPAIKLAAAASINKKIALLATASTNQTEYIEKLRAKYAALCSFIKIDGSSLIQMIEDHWGQNNTLKIKKSLQKEIESIKNVLTQQNADQLVLGCTHFLHMKAEFRTALLPNSITIQDSINGIKNRYQDVLQQESFSFSIHLQQQPHICILSSKSEYLQKKESKWDFWIQKYRFHLEFFEN